MALCMSRPVLSPFCRITGKHPSRLSEVNSSDTNGEQSLYTEARWQLKQQTVTQRSWTKHDPRWIKLNTDRSFAEATSREVRSWLQGIIEEMCALSRAKDSVVYMQM
jgi:hypothetical protein